jgi:hypothetical protein
MQGTFRNGARGEGGAKVERQSEPPVSVPHDVLTDLECVSTVGNAEHYSDRSEQVDFNLEYP